MSGPICASYRLLVTRQIAIDYGQTLSTLPRIPVEPRVSVSGRLSHLYDISLEVISRSCVVFSYSQNVNGCSDERVEL